MPFGRLDVFFPDGLLRTFLLTDPNTSIGRSTGNTIALDTDTISRYHLTITLKDGEVYITDLDSANGTFVDGIRLPDNEPCRLFGGEEINIGDLRLIFHDIDESPTRPIAIPEEVTRYIEQVNVDFRLELEGPEIAIPPGSHTSASLKITNMGSEAGRFVVEVSGVPKEWTRVDRPELEINAGKTADVSIGFKPPRRSSTTPGEYAITVRVRRKTDPAQTLVAQIPLRVLPYSGFGMALERRHNRAGDPFRLHLHNQGSAPLPLTLLIREPAAHSKDGAFGAMPDGRAQQGELRARISTPQMVLGAGQRTVAQIVAVPRRSPLFGSTRQIPFDVIARSGDAAAFTVATRAYVLVKPPLPRWSAYAIGGIGLALVLLACAALIALFNVTPTPVIRSFSAAANRVQQGQPLVVNWQVQNADRVVLTVNGVPVVGDVQPDTRSAQISTEGLTGEVLVTLLAENRAESAEASLTVNVFAPLRVQRFTLAPNPLMRYVVQTLTLSWDVENAVSTRISGLEGLTTAPVQEVYGRSGMVSVAVVPTAPSYSFSLTAQDALGNVLVENLTVQPQEPTCLTVGDINLYDIPRGQVISTVPNGTSVVVIAQDISGEWLRVLGRGWGERATLSCTGFTVENLLVDTNVPTAAPTLPPPPTLAAGSGTPTRPPATVIVRTLPPATPVILQQNVQGSTPTATPTPAIGRVGATNTPAPTPTSTAETVDVQIVGTQIVTPGATPAG